MTGAYFLAGYPPRKRILTNCPSIHIPSTAVNPEAMACTIVNHPLSSPNRAEIASVPRERVIRVCPRHPYYTKERMRYQP